MIIINEFVWNQDHYVYHLTEKEAMPNIIVEGLTKMWSKKSASW